MTNAEIESAARMQLPTASKTVAIRWQVPIQKPVKHFSFRNLPNEIPVTKSIEKPYMVTFNLMRNMETGYYEWALESIT